MRTLKKTLCLVLVLAMMVGLCAVGASAAKLADYPDKDSIKNTEAVALLSALGILEGDERGFRPNDTLTRAEGAAILTRLHNTNGIGTSSYTDMASAAWAQPYVAYCEAQGIIAGYGDGRFGPQDTLTVAQFAKMLLTALGYKANIEGLTGAAWEINVVKLINKIDLANGLADLDYNAAITRDQAAQMAFTALKTKTVDYDSQVKVTTGDGTQVEVGANAKEIENSAYDYRLSNGDHWMQFIETYFSTVKISDKLVKDRFGIPTNYWFKGNDRTDDTWTPAKALCDAPKGEVIKTYAEGIARVTYGTIFTDAGFLAKTTVDVVENGADAPSIEIAKGDSALGHSLAKYSGGTALLIKNGSTYTLYVKYPYLAQVSAVVPATESTSKNREVALKVWSDATYINTNFETESFAKNDYVLVYPAGLLSAAKADGASILVAEPVEATSGSATAYATRGAAVPGVTIDSTKYDFAALGFLGTGAAPALNKPVTAYLSNGYIMGLKAATATAADYVFVLGQTAGVKDAFGKVSADVGYLKQDASTATASLFGAVEGHADTVTAGWYTMSPKGATTQFNAPAAPFTQALNKAITNDGTKWSVKASQPQIADGITANNNTVFIIRSGVAGTFTAYTGVKSLPTFSGTGTKNTANALINNTTGVAAVVFLDLFGETAQDASVAPIYLVSNSSSATREVAGVTYHTYSVIKDGKLTTIQDVNNVITSATATGLIVPHFNADGYLTACEPATGATIAANAAYETTADVAFSGGVLTYKDGTAKSVMVADDAAYYVYNAKVNPIALISGADAEYLVGKAGKLSLVQTSAANTTIKEVYFIVD